MKGVTRGTDRLYLHSGEGRRLLVPERGGTVIPHTPLVPVRLRWTALLPFVCEDLRPRGL